MHINLSQTITVIVYLMILGYLGYLGYRRSKTAEDYLLAGRNVHPYVMALSYGATFISTSAIVGFGGVAGMVGMSLLWLTFLNIFVGIFIAFVFLGGPTRRMGHHLGAHTFPELLGKRYNSRFIQVFAGVIIFLLMPVYAGAVLLGGVKFLSVSFGMSLNQGILLLSVIIALYVVAGGLRGVMYTDAFQGSVMFVGMVVLLVFAYVKAGGFISAHKALAALQNSPAGGGLVGYAAMPTFGSKWWWIVISSMVLGVGIGVLAQPQLAVRFMTVRSKKELNRACAIGGLFILSMTGGAFTVGALSNVYFQKTAGKVAFDYVNGNIGTIIPTFIDQAMPKWFGLLFLLALLAAAMSTLSSQFHVMGTSIGRDVYERGIRRKVASDRLTRLITQAGVALAIVFTVVLTWQYAKNPKEPIIASATSIFFALCASTFLPTFLLGLFWRRMNRAAAISSMLAGFLMTAFWLTFMQVKPASALRICGWLFEKKSLVAKMPWPVVDAIILALPLSFIVAFVVALVTKPMSKEHLDNCYSTVSG
ncbi:MAG: sodium:solute symporter family protein [Planctomycetes bacterium]|nr:sodium:solute symporter family protein [Planctomycetota bacterium]